MKTVYFVRHGETRFNQEQRLQGWNDSPLSELGEAQVGKVSKSLIPLGIRRALISPLGRARQTASIIQAELGIELEPIDDLREVSFGVFEGNRLDQLNELFPGLWEQRQADKWNYRPPMGEANKDAVPRAQAVVKRIEDWPEAEPALIIAHFAINRIILAQLAGLEPASLVCMDVPHLVVYRARWEENRWSLSYKYADSPNGDFVSGWLHQDGSVKQIGG